MRNNTEDRTHSGSVCQQGGAPGSLPQQLLGVIAFLLLVFFIVILTKTKTIDKATGDPFSLLRIKKRIETKRKPAFKKMATFLIFFLTGVSIVAASSCPTKRPGSNQTEKLMTTSRSSNDFKTFTLRNNLRIRRRPD